MDTDSRDRGKYYINFPYRIVIARWLFALAEMGLATLFVFKFGFISGVIYLIYGFTAVFVILPLTRCNRCFYYGKICNFGLGKWAAAFVPESEEKIYSSAYGFSILFWPLRIIPIMTGLIPIIGLIRGSLLIPSGEIGDMAEFFFSGLRIIPEGLFLIYLLVLYFHRKYYRAKSCTRCYHKTDCPVYDKKALLETRTGDNTVIE